MKESHIADLLARRSQPLLSLEFFPPRDHKGFAFLGSSIERMRSIRADFVTVTYGAGGSTRDLTLTVCDVLRHMGFGPVMPHLTCVGASRRELEELADQLFREGYRNIMALRGDPPRDGTPFRPAADGLAHASELVALLKGRHPEFNCGVACYPEGHPEAPSLEADVARLKEKFEAGADFATTQLFFDNRHYYDLVERCRAAGITQPILPGLMPALSLKQVDRMLALSRVAFPDALRTAMQAAGGSGPVTEAIGIDWTVKQIHDLLEHGAPGVHLYILNRARTALSPALAECLETWRS